MVGMSNKIPNVNFIFPEELKSQDRLSYRPWRSNYIPLQTTFAKDSGEIDCIELSHQFLHCLPFLFWFITTTSICNNNDEMSSRPQYLSRICFWLAGLTPTGSATFFHGDWSWNIYYHHTLPLIQEGQLSVSGQKMCTILVKLLRGLSSKCLVR